jgi:hypothetical protein
MSRANLCLAAACLLVTSAAPLAAQGFDGVIKFVNYNDDGNAPDTMVQMTKGSKVRFEGMGKEGGGAMIMDGDKRIVLMPERKQYMVMVNKMSEHEPPKSERTKGTAVRTGKTETVAGIPCEVWHYTGTKHDGTPESGDACLSKGVGFMLNRLAGGRMAQFFTEGSQAFSEALASGMGVMKVTTNGKVQLVAVKVQATSVPDAMFSPPSDYTVLDVSKMGGMRKKP